MDRSTVDDGIRESQLLITVLYIKFVVWQRVFSLVYWWA